VFRGCYEECFGSTLFFEPQEGLIASNAPAKKPRNNPQQDRISSLINKSANREEDSENRTESTESTNLQKKIVDVKYHSMVNKKITFTRVLLEPKRKSKVQQPNTQSANNNNNNSNMGTANTNTATKRKTDNIDDPTSKRNRIDLETETE
jgi:hypothetical protein